MIRLFATANSAEAAAILVEQRINRSQHMDEKTVHLDSAQVGADPVVDSLRKRGHRITAQREIILQIFRELPHGNHLSAEELHVKLGERGSNVSLATAYRTLKLLSSLGLLRELDFAEGHKHYELKQDTLPHQHIICIGCNTTLEFEDHFLEEAGQKIGARHNFEVIDAQFKIFGLCPNCREQQKPLSSTGRAASDGRAKPPNRTKT
jgi:Fur family transcriptional regulator, ferric uptake regulator